MSSTTEESDWNKSPKLRPPHSIPRTVRPSPQPIPHHDWQPPEPLSPTLDTPRASETAAQLESQFTQTILPSTAPPFAQPPTPATLAGTDGISHAALIQNTPEWEAARASVLGQMVTSGDLDATPTAKVTRGGVKTGGRRGRGGRRPKVKIEGADGVTEEIAAAAGVKIETPVRGKNRGGRPRGSRAGTNAARASINRGGRPRGSLTVNRGGRPRGGRAGGSAAGVLGHAVKRKRKRGDDDDDEKDDTDVSEEFNLLEHTSSGRRITQAKTFSPVVLGHPASSTKKAIPYIPRADTPPTVKKAKLKRRKPGEAAVCINCGRGHSPNSNQIVFCDGCNTPWHQFCHDRPITPSVIQFEEKEWICFECATAREEKGHIAGKIAAPNTMTLAEKRTYLQGLEKSELVSLLLHASSLHEDLPIFQPPPLVSIPTIIEPRPLPVPIQSSLDEEEYIEIYVEQEPLPYPKAGNGLVLPPEDGDTALLIDEDVVTYSHSWKSTHGWEGPGGMNWAAAETGMVGGGGRVAIGVGA